MRFFSSRAYWVQNLETKELLKKLSEETYDGNHAVSGDPQKEMVEVKGVLTKGPGPDHNPSQGIPGAKGLVNGNPGHNQRVMFLKKSLFIPREHCREISAGQKFFNQPGVKAWFQARELESSRELQALEKKKPGEKVSGSEDT